MYTLHEIMFDYIYPKIKDNKNDTIEINKLYDFFNSIDLLQYEESDLSLKKEKFVSDHRLDFISEIIEKKIEENNTKYSFVLNFDGFRVCVNIFSKNAIMKTNFINELKKYIQFTLSINPVKTNVTINYNLTDEKKIIKLKQKVPGKNEINSGSCKYYTDHSIINIWRKEELLKVTVHELFHALKHDNYTDNDDILQHYSEKYDITLKKLNTRESYTEIWANLINCFLVSQKCNNSKKAFKGLVKIEKFHSLFQAQKILYNYYNNGVELDYHTNVTSYFIIRAELYSELHKFLKFCRTNNEKYVKLVNEDKWFLFLKSKNKIHPDDKKYKNKKSYLFKNLRMSVVELNIL